MSPRPSPRDPPPDTGFYGGMFPAGGSSRQTVKLNGEPTPPEKPMTFMYIRDGDWNVADGLPPDYQQFTINPQLEVSPAATLGTPRSIISRARTEQLAERGQLFDFGTSSDGDTPRSARQHTGASSGLASTSVAAQQQQQSSQQAQPQLHRHPDSSAASTVTVNADPSADAYHVLPTTYARSKHEHEQHSTLASTAAAAKPAMTKKHLWHPGASSAPAQAAGLNGDPQVRGLLGVHPGAAVVDKAEPVKGVFLVAGSNGVALTGNPAPDVYCLDQNHRDLSGHPGWEVTESQPCFLLPCMTKHEVVVNDINKPARAYSPDRPSHNRKKKPGELFTWDCMCFSLMYGTGKSAKQYSELTRPSKPRVLKDK